MALDARLRAGAGAFACFRTGWLAGFVFYLVGMYWLLLLSEVAISVPWLKYPAWIVGCAYLAVYTGLIAAWSTVLVRRTGLPLALVFPFVWVVVEGLRGMGEIGFPWYQPGYTQQAFLPFIQMASLGGVTLVTAWVLLLNVLLWRAWRGGARLRAGLGLLFAILLPFVWGQRVLDAAPRRTGPTIALVQGNVPGEIKWSGEHQEEILAGFLALSRRALEAEPRPSLIIWPETATGSYTRRQMDQALEVARFAAATGVPVFAGFADFDFDSNGVRRFANAAGMFRPDRTIGAVYAKRHLVPFGERMPFQSWFPALGQMQLGQAEWTPGVRGILFPSAGGPFACLICFESIFPPLARADVIEGARWLVNVTNDEWFGNSAALEQHAAMARFRAVENHVPLARCANTGLTLVFDAYGRTVAHMPAWTTGVLTAALPVPGPKTWWTRAGDWPGLLAWIVVALWTLWSGVLLLTGKTRRH